MAFDVRMFESVKPLMTDPNEEYLDDTLTARAAVLFREMMGRPESVLSKRKNWKSRERRAWYDSGVGNADLDLMKQIPKTGKAVVHLPVAQNKK